MISASEAEARICHTATSRRELGRAEAKLVIRDRRQQRLSGQSGGKVIRGEPSRNKEFHLKRSAGKSYVHAKNNLASSG